MLRVVAFLCRHVKVAEGNDGVELGLLLHILILEHLQNSINESIEAVAISYHQMRDNTA